jgi:hypothetical protein
MLRSAWLAQELLSTFEVSSSTCDHSACKVLSEFTCIVGTTAAFKDQLRSSINPYDKVYVFIYTCCSKLYVQLLKLHLNT